MNTSNRLVFGLLVFGFLWANLFVPVMAPDSPYSHAMEMAMAFCFGGLAAEVCLLAIWSVLAAEPITRRLPKTFSLLILGWLAWIGGLRWDDDKLPTEFAVVSAGVGLGLFVFVAISLLLVRWRMQRRIQHLTSLAVTNQSRLQFSIGQLLVWTTIVAVILGVGKLALPKYSVGFNPIGRELLAIIGVVLLFFCAVNLLVWPCLLVALEEKLRGVWLAALLVCFVLVPPFVIIVIAAFAGFPNSNRVFGGYYSAALGLILPTIGSLLVVRSCGFRLRRTEFSAAPSE